MDSLAPLLSFEEKLKIFELYKAGYDKRAIMNWFASFPENGDRDLGRLERYLAPFFDKPITRPIDLGGPRDIWIDRDLI